MNHGNDSMKGEAKPRNWLDDADDVGTSVICGGICHRKRPRIFPTAMDEGLHSLGAGAVRSKW